MLATNNAASSKPLMTTTMLVSSEQVLVGSFDRILGFVGERQLCLVQHDELFHSEEAFDASWQRGSDLDWAVHAWVL